MIAVQAGLAWISAVVIAITACGPARSGSIPQPGPDAAPERAPTARVLSIAVRIEPANLSARPFTSAGIALHVPRRLFNAKLALIDGRAQPQLELAESLPQLNTDSWRVFPDGRMETSYRLKPGLRWHDGTPLSAEDFVFAWRVYGSPEYGQSGAPPFSAMDDVVAPDERTVLVRWARPYPGADHLSDRDREFLPLPRSLLKDVVEQGVPDVVATHPYWTRDYVGLGPYRVERWEPGAFIEAAAFEHYALGRPTIGRIRLVPSPDANTTLASVLAGEIQLATDGSIGPNAEILQREWAASTAGVVLSWPNSWRTTGFQLRPELATPRSLLDLRVRKAIAHAIDRDSINEAVYFGDAIYSESMIWAKSEYGASQERAGTTMARYPFDLRRSEQLMNEAGLAKGNDGYYTSVAEGRFSGENGGITGADNEPELLILADGFRRAGFDLKEAALPAVQAQDARVRATFPTIFTTNTNMGIPAALSLTTEQIPRADNRWRGSNRGGWANDEYDLLADRFNTTLDRGQRVDILARMIVVFKDELPAVPLFFRAQPFAYRTGLLGPAEAAPESNMLWNVHQWELR